MASDNTVGLRGTRSQGQEVDLKEGLQVNFWSLFYNLLHPCPPHHHDCHSSSGSSSSSSSGGYYDDTTDDASNDATTDDGVPDVSNDTGVAFTPSNNIFATASAAGKTGILFAGAAIAFVAVAIVVRQRNSHSGSNSSAINMEEEDAMRNDSGLVKNRLKSFGEFMKGQTLEPNAEGFEMGNNSSNVDFVRVEA